MYHRPIILEKQWHFKKARRKLLFFQAKKTKKIDLTKKLYSPENCGALLFKKNISNAEGKENNYRNTVVKKEQESLKSKAATIIQAAYRGYRVRKNLNIGNKKSSSNLSLNKIHRKKNIPQSARIENNCRQIKRR